MIPTGRLIITYQWESLSVIRNRPADIVVNIKPADPYNCTISTKVMYYDWL